MADDRIPLFCSICPKRPTFSDTSHLLTHVGSKGHLSNYYKGKIRSAHDEHTRRMIDEYDAWYNEWGLEDLMCERITLKDKKKLRCGANSYTAPSLRQSSARALQNRSANRQFSGLLNSRQSLPIAYGRGQLGNLSRPHAAVDPTLVAEAVKSEPKYVPKAVNEDSPRLPPISESHWIRHTSPHQVSSVTLRSHTQPAQHARDETHSSLFVRPRTPATILSTGLRDEIVEPVEDEYDDGTAKLKGVLWPGMSIFDSATAIARRRRNQKKDDSVIVRLKENSQLVDCTEVVYNPDWSINKERFIDGLPSSSPPPESPRMLASMPYEEQTGPIDLESYIQLDRDLNTAEEQNVRFSTDSVASTPHEQGRYNLRNESRSDQRVRYSNSETPLERKRRVNIYRDDDFRADIVKSRRISVLTRGLEEDEEYIPSEHRAQRRRSNGNRRSYGRLSFGDRLKLARLEAETGVTEDEQNTKDSKNKSSVLPSDDDPMFHAPTMQDPFIHNQSSSFASGLDQGSLYSVAPASMNMPTSYGGMSATRNQSSLPVDSFGNGSFGLPFGHMVHPSLGFGQYPGRSFGYGFGMQAVPIGYNHGNVHHVSPNDLSSIQFGIPNAVHTIAPEIWGFQPQDDSLGKTNGVEEHIPRRSSNILHKITQSRGESVEETDLPLSGTPTSPAIHPGRPSSAQSIDHDPGKMTLAPKGHQASVIAVEPSIKNEDRLANSTEYIPVVDLDEETDDGKTVSEINTPTGF